MDLDIKRLRGTPGETGYDALRRYAKISSEFFREILAVLEERCEAELSYAKQLRKLAGRLSKACKLTLGNLDGSWNGVAEEMEAEADIHKALSEALSDELIKQLRTLFDSQSKAKKEVECQVEKVTNKLSKKRGDQLKAKRKSYILSKESEKVQKTVSDERRRSVRLLNQKQVAKLQSKRIKLEETNLDAAKAYHDSCVVSERSRQELEHSIAGAAVRLEGLEEQRLSEMQCALGRYRRVMGATGPQLAAVCGKKFNESFYSIDVKSDLQIILAQYRPAKVPHRVWVLCDYYEEDFSHPMCPERRIETLQRYQVWFEKDIEKERRQKENLDNLSYAYSCGSRSRDLSNFTTRINDTCQIMNYLDYHHRKLQNCIDAMCSRPLDHHPLSRYQERMKDKGGLRQTVLRIPLSACHSLNIPPSLATMNLVKDALNEELHKEPQRIHHSLSCEELNSRSSSPDPIGIYEPLMEHDRNVPPTSEADGGESSKVKDTSSPESEYAPSSESSGVSSDSTAQWRSCTVLYDYKAIRNDELNLYENEVIEILDQSTGDWWRGRKSNGKTGLFPSNYVDAV